MGARAPLCSEPNLERVGVALVRRPHIQWQYSPHSDIMLLLSSWMNFFVTASSIICFTCGRARPREPLVSIVVAAGCSGALWRRSVRASLTWRLVFRSSFSQSLSGKGPIGSQ